jgi:hypothetical protein
MGRFVAITTFVGLAVATITWGIIQYGRVQAKDAVRRRSARHVREVLAREPYATGMSLLSHDPVLRAEYATLSGGSKQVVQAILDLQRRLELPGLTASERGVIVAALEEAPSWATTVPYQQLPLSPEA